VSSVAAEILEIVTKAEKGQLKPQCKL